MCLVQLLDLRNLVLLSVLAAYVYYMVTSFKMLYVVCLYHHKNFINFIDKVLRKRFAEIIFPHVIPFIFFSFGQLLIYPIAIKGSNTLGKKVQSWLNMRQGLCYKRFY